MGEEKWYKKLKDWFFKSFIIIAVCAFILALMEQLDKLHAYGLSGKMIVLLLVIFWLNRTIFKYK